MLGTQTKRFLMLFFCLALVLAVSVPARADDRVIIDYNDYISDVVYGDNNSTVTVSGVPLDKSMWRLYSSGWTTLETIQGDSGMFDYTLSSSASYILNWSPFGADNYYWDLTYIPAGTQIELVFEVQIYADDPLSVYVVSQEEGYSLAYYDEDFNVVGNTNAYPDDVVVDGYYHINMTVNPPEGAKYMRFGMMVDKFKLSADAKVRVVGWGLSMIFDVDSLVYLQQETGKTNAMLQSILEQMESEKDEANSAGSSGVGDLTDAVPDYSEGFKTALQGLADSMSYTGTEAKIAIPAVNVPGLDGLYGGFQMMEAQEVDFSVYINMMPGNLLLLVQSLLTIALIVYCFKELYGSVSYVLTLRGGEG